MANLTDFDADQLRHALAVLLDDQHAPHYRIGWARSAIKATLERLEQADAEADQPDLPHISTLRRRLVVGS